jgi:hypothetical protein
MAADVVDLPYPQVAAEDNISVCYQKMFTNRDQRDSQVKHRQEKKEGELAKAMHVVKKAAMREQQTKAAESERLASIIAKDRARNAKAFAEAGVAPPPLSTGTAAAAAGGPEFKRKRRKRGEKRPTPLNICQRMELQVTGPFSILLECMKKKQRVRVRTRALRGTRGFVEGTVCAFVRCSFL